MRNGFYFTLITLGLFLHLIGWAQPAAVLQGHPHSDERYFPGARFLPQGDEFGAASDHLIHPLRRRAVADDFNPAPVAGQLSGGRIRSLKWGTSQEHMRRRRTSDEGMRGVLVGAAGGGGLSDWLTGSNWPEDTDSLGMPVGEGDDKVKTYLTQSEIQEVLASMNAFYLKNGMPR